MSFLPEISSYCIDMIKLTGSASREVLDHVVLLCARSDTHALLAPNYKEQQQIMISFNFQSVWVFGELNPSPRSRVFTSTSLDCSPHSCLFSSVIARLAVHKNCFKMWQRIGKSLKPKKTKTKTKQKEKKYIRFLESKDHRSIKLFR